MIRKIRLKHFKSFEDSGVLDLSRVNLFAGKNGRGKSSVIQSLLLLAQSFDKDRGISCLDLNGSFVSLGSFDDLNRRDGNSSSFSISFKTDDEIDNDIVCEFIKDVTDSRKAKIKELTVDGVSKMETVASTSVISAEDGSPILFENGEFILGETSENRVGTTSDIVGFSQFQNVIFISADRKGGVDYIKQDAAWSRKKGVGIHGEYVMNMLEVASEEQRVEVNKWFRLILDGGSVMTERNEEREEIYLYIDPAGTRNGFKPSNVGFGYSYILSILVSIVMSDNGSKLFIENPEAHLHPSAQAKLVEVMVELAKEKNIQLFIESHSDHVLHGLQIAVMDNKIGQPDFSVFFFSFKDGESNLSDVKQLEISPSGHIRRPPVGFCDQAEMDLSKLIGL